MKKYLNIGLIVVLVLLLGINLYGKAVTKTINQWLAELPAGKIYTSVSTYLSDTILQLSGVTLTGASSTLTIDKNTDFSAGIDITGALTATTASTFSNIVTVSGMCQGGSVSSLPTSGYSAGTIVWLQSNQGIYVSTATVESVSSWVAVGQQTF